MSRQLIPEFQDPNLTESEKCFRKKNENVSLTNPHGDVYRENLEQEALQSLRPDVIPEIKSEKAIFSIMAYMRQDTPDIYQSLKEFVLRGSTIPEGHTTSLVQQGILQIDHNGKRKADSNAIAFIKTEQGREMRD